MKNLAVSLPVSARPRVGVGLAAGLYDDFAFSSTGRRVISCIQGADGYLEGTEPPKDSGGYLGCGMKFNGTDNQVQIPKPWNIDRAFRFGQGSVAVLFQKDRATYPSGYSDRLIMPASLYGWGLFFNAEFSTLCFQRVGGGGINLVSTIAITDTTQAHIVSVSFTVNGSNTINRAWIYIDGRFGGTATGAGSINAMTSYYFGNIPGYSQWFMGTIYRTWLWSRILGPEEHQLLAANFWSVYGWPTSWAAATAVSPGAPSAQAWYWRALQMKAAA